MLHIQHWFRRGLIYLIGLFLMAFGVSVSKVSDLGVSPVNSIPCVVSEISGIDMGLCTTGVFIFFIFIQLLILRRDFKTVYLLQIICSMIFGMFVSITNQIAGIFLPACTNYAMSILYIGISIILVALGILLYLEADILSLPGEGVMQAVSGKAGIPVSSSKMIFDWTVVIIAAALSLIFLEQLTGVREGTVISAFGVGICLKFLNKYCLKPVQVFLKCPQTMEGVNP
jgi:uncharacterized membrane protein YczE